MEYGKSFYSHKFKRSGLRYEVALSILDGKICWISRPHIPGRLNDLTIFRNLLMMQLEEFKHIEADDGYIGRAPMKVKCPGCCTVPEERKKMMNPVWS